MKFGFKLAGVHFNIGLDELAFNGKAKDKEVTRQTEIIADKLSEAHKDELKAKAKSESKKLKAEAKRLKAEAKKAKKAAKAAAKAEKKAAKKAAKNRHEIPDAYKHPVEFDN